MDFANLYSFEAELNFRLILFLIIFPKLVNAYVMTSREPPLNTAACRLLLDIMPGLETAVVFQEKVLYVVS